MSTPGAVFSECNACCLFLVMMAHSSFEYVCSWGRVVVRSSHRRCVEQISPNNSNNNKGVTTVAFRSVQSSFALCINSISTPNPALWCVPLYHLTIESDLLAVCFLPVDSILSAKHWSGILLLLPVGATVMAAAAVVVEAKTKWVLCHEAFLCGRLGQTIFADTEDRVMLR